MFFETAGLQAPAAATATAPLPTIDPHNFIHWNVLNMDSVPMAALKLDAANISTNRSAHAALLLISLSDELEHAHPEVDQTLNAGFQTRFERPVDFSNVCRFPSIGANAYNTEEIAWCQTTIEFLGDQLSEEGRLSSSAVCPPRNVPKVAPSPGPGLCRLRHGPRQLCGLLPRATAGSKTLIRRRRRTMLC